MTINLHRQEQIYYTLPDLTAATPTGPVTIPPTGWEASFDNSLTWHAGTPHPDQPTLATWLIRGPNMPGTDDTNTPAGILISHNTTPLIRLRDNPETVIVEADPIMLWT